MESFPISQTEKGLHIDGIPDAVNVVSISGHKAQRLSDLALHQSDLRFALEALETLSTAPGNSPFIQEALWRIAIVHYIKCFGDGVRFQLSAPKVYKGAPAEAMEAFNYFKALRNKHVAHDESAYAQSIPGAALNDGSKSYKVEKIVCFSARAETLNQENFGNLHQLVSDALQWASQEFDKLCNELTATLETHSYSELAALPPLKYQFPAITEAYTRRKGYT